MGSVYVVTVYLPVYVGPVRSLVTISIIVMECNDNNKKHNNQVVDSSDQEFQYDYGTFEWFGLQLKNLSNVMKGVGQQMQLRSEVLKNSTRFESESSMHTGETKQKLAFRIFDVIFDKKNLYPDSCQESILVEISQQEIAMDLFATTSDVADILIIMLRDWAEIEKSNQSLASPPAMSEDMDDKDVTRS